MSKITLDYNTHLYMVGRIFYGFKMAAENEILTSQFWNLLKSPRLIVLVKEITIYRTQTTTFHTRQFTVCIMIFQWYVRAIVLQYIQSSLKVILNLFHPISLKTKRITSRVHQGTSCPNESFLPRTSQRDDSRASWIIKLRVDLLAMYFQDNAQFGRHANAT